MFSLIKYLFIGKPVGIYIAHVVAVIEYLRLKEKLNKYISWFDCDKQVPIYKYKYIIHKIKYLVQWMLKRTSVIDIFGWAEPPKPSHLFSSMIRR